MSCHFCPTIRHSADDAGFTLVEVLIAIMIFTVGFIGVAAMQAMAVRGNGVGKYLTERSATAQDQMESLLGLPFTHTNLAAGATSTDVNIGPYQFHTEVSITDNSPAPGLKLIRVTVTDPNGHQTRMVRIKEQYVY